MQLAPLIFPGPPEEQEQELVRVLDVIKDFQSKGLTALSYSSREDGVWDPRMLPQSCNCLPHACLEESAWI